MSGMTEQKAPAAMIRLEVDAGWHAEATATPATACEMLEGTVLACQTV